MNRREFLQLGGASAAAAALPAWVRAQAPAGGSSARRPNIVLIVSDDHGWPDYGFMGHPQIQTPNIDRLAAQGVCFTHGYVPTPLCCPSLASLMTGRYPHQHKIAFNDPPQPAAAPPAEKRALFDAGREKMNGFMEAWPTLPRLLGAAGYLSLQTGKWWQGNFRHGGFTHGMTTGEKDKGGRHGDAGLEIGRKTMAPIEEFVAAARRQDKPFFIWYAPMMPHQPHTPPERLIEKYAAKTDSPTMAHYWAMVEWFDETCGQLLQILEKNGQRDNTIVAYLADNGWFQSEAGPGPVRSKLTPYDGGLRTPIMVSWPGRLAPRRVETPVSSLDLMPTLLPLAGIEPPAGLPGLNLLNEQAVAGREAICGEVFAHNAVEIEDPVAGLDFRWAVSGGWKLIDPNPARHPEMKAELYHLAEDPREERDLAASQPEKVAELRRRLDGWWKPEYKGPPVAAPGMRARKAATAGRKKKARTPKAQVKKQ